MALFLSYCQTQVVSFLKLLEPESFPLYRKYSARLVSFLRLTTKAVSSANFTSGTKVQVDTTSFVWTENNTGGRTHPSGVPVIHNQSIRQFSHPECLSAADRTRCLIQGTRVWLVSRVSSLFFFFFKKTRFNCIKS